MKMYIAISSTTEPLLLTQDPSKALAQATSSVDEWSKTKPITVKHVSVHEVLPGMPCKNNNSKHLYTKWITPEGRIFDKWHCEKFKAQFAPSQEQLVSAQEA